MVANPTSQAGTPSYDEILRRVGPLLVAALGAFMLYRSWRKWPDLLVDFGQQLYLAWQMSEGRNLYEDLVCNYGPLAPYANAWAFECFGASFMTLVGLNLAVFLGIAFFTYRLLLRIGTPLSALVSGVLLMLVFAFSQLSQTGNYNYATPYENSLTIGLLPSLAALWLALRHLDGGRGLLRIGLCLGLAFLTKPEVFLAGAAGVFASLATASWSECWDRARVIRTLGRTLLGTAIPILAAWALMSTAMGTSTALSGTLGSWPALFGSGASELLFYRRGMGFDDLGSKLLGVTLTSGLWLLVGAVAVVSGVGVAKLPGPLRWPAALLAAVLVTILASQAFDVLDWHKAARPLQFLMLAVAALALRQVFLRRGGQSGPSDPETSRHHLARLAYATFAGVLLLKMVLNIRVYHYGFVLAMPAAMVASTAFVAWLPQWAQKRAGHRVTSAAIGLAMLAGFSQSMWKVSDYELGLKKTTVGEDANRMLADDRAHFVNPTLALIERLQPKTMVVFPEGSILNFLTRCPNPTSFYNFMPTGYAIFGEHRILESLRKTPPDVIVLVEKDTSEFGYRYFGTEYAAETMKWVRQNFVQAGLFGNQPLRNQQFGIEVLQRRR